MRLQYISCKNFRKLSDFHHDYKSGITGVMGNTGSGKTTFIDELQFFMLSGDTPKGLTKSDLLSWDCKTGHGTLGFEHDEIEYTLVRNLHGPKVELSWLDDSRKTTKLRAKEARDRMQEMLGMSSDVLAQCCFVKQGNIWGIVTMTDAERLTYFQRITGCITAERVRSKINTACSSLPAFVDRSVEIAEYTQKVKEGKEAVAEKVRNAGDWLTTYNLRQSAYPSDAQDKLLLPTEEQYQASNANLTQTLAGHEAALIQFAKTHNLDQQIELVTSPTLEDRAAHEAYARHSMVLAEAEQVRPQYDTLKAEWEVLQKTNTSQGELVQAVTTQHQELVTKISTQKALLAQAQQTVAALQSGTCPTCGSSVEAAASKAQETCTAVATTLADLESEYLVLDSAKHQQQIALHDTMQRIAANEQFTQPLHDVLHRAKGPAPKVWDLTQVPAQDKAFAEYTQRLSAQNAAQQQFQQYQRQVTTAQLNLDALVTRGFLPTAERELLTQQMTELQEAHQQHQVWVNQSQVAQAACAADEKILATYNADAAREAKIIAKKEILKQCMFYLHRDQLPKIVMSYIRKALSFEIALWLREFGAPFSAELTDDMEYVVYWGDDAPKPTTSLSGGQKIILSVCHHMALIKILAGNVPLLVLDEPTNHLGEVEITIVREVLTKIRETAGRGVPIFVATHSSLLIPAFTRTKRFSGNDDE